MALDLSSVDSNECIEEWADKPSSSFVDFSSSLTSDHMLWIHIMRLKELYLQIFSKNRTVRRTSNTEKIKVGKILN